MRRRFYAVIAAALFVGQAAALAQAPVPPGGTIRGEVGTRLDQHLSRAERFGFSGAVLIARDGEVLLHKGYGLADRERGQPVTAETIFDIGSITKPFTASAVLKLVDEGKLRVSDSITRFFQKVPADKRSITVHHLLTHTSGLQDGFGGDYDLISRDSLVSVALSSRVQSAPGAKYEYSNAGYSLLGAIIEKASGQPYERYLNNHVLRPAGLTSTGYRLVDWTGKPLAVGYRGSGRLGTPIEQRWADDGPSWHLRANGGLLSTASDLYRWLSAFHANRIVSAASYEKAVTPPPGFDYGYGWEVAQLADGKRYITHNGSNGYFYARAAYIPDDKLTVVFATNDQANRTIENDILALTSGREVQQIPRAGNAAFSLAPYGGRYRTSSGVEFDIRATAEGLEIRSAPATIVASLILAGTNDVERGNAILDSVIINTVGGMATGNHASYRERFWPFRDYRIDGEIEFWSEVFSDWRTDYGEYRAAQILGTAESRNANDRQLITYVALKYSNGERVIRIMQPLPSTGKFFVATVSAAQWPSRYVLVPGSSTEFSTYNLELRKSAAVTFILGEDGVRAIVLPGGLRAEKVGAA